jgi:hypothetical protein
MSLTSPLDFLFESTLHLSFPSLSLGLKRFKKKRRGKRSANSNTVSVQHLLNRLIILETVSDIVQQGSPNFSTFGAQTSSLYRSRARQLKY